MLKACQYIPRLETERLVLRKITGDDVEDLRKWLGRDELYTYWGRSASKAEKDPGLLQAINVDVKGVTMVARACVPYMHKGSFQIIVGSVASFSPLPGQAVYSASKVYEKYLAVALHEELKPQGINVMYLAPGNMATEMMALTTETIRDHGAKISHLPYLNLDKVPVVSLRRAEAGKRFYTPLLFNKAFRAFMKLIPASLGAKISSIE